MTEEKTKELIQSGVADIIISIDGVSQDVYEKYRVGGRVGAALNALKMLQELKAHTNSDVNIIPQFIVFKHNQHEMESFSELCRSMGLTASFKAPYLRSKNSSFSLSDYPEFIRATFREIKDLRAAMTDCPNAKNVFTVLLDGSVVICCHDYGKST